MNCLKDFEQRDNELKEKIEGKLSWSDKGEYEELVHLICERNKHLGKWFVFRVKNIFKNP